MVHAASLHSHTLSPRHISGASMKLLIQIPCFNEAETLPLVVAEIPSFIEGIDEIEILIIDDGSTDNTVAVARELGIHHIISNSKNLGLARSFQRGIDECLRAGADIIVNTDGDNQYCGRCIPDLVRPILLEGVDITIGDRNTEGIAHFSKSKKLLQKVGSAVVRYLSGLNVMDSVSGFRAMSRHAAIRMSIFSTFSYTIEMLIQAGNEKLLVKSIPISVNGETRESRLFTSNWQFISKAAVTIIRIYTMYKPLRAFLAIAMVLSTVGAIPIIRFIYFYSSGDGAGHVQSLILGSLFIVLGFVTFISGLVADIISRNRIILQEILVRTRYQELEAIDKQKMNL